MHGDISTRPLRNSARRAGAHRVIELDGEPDRKKGVVAPAKRPHRCGRSSPHGRQNNPLWLISSCHRGRQTNSTLLSCLKSLPVGGAVVTGIGRPALPRWWSWSLCAPLRFGD